MRYVILVLIFAAGLCVAAARAGEPKDGEKADRPPKGEVHEKMLKEHDKDGDGKLSDDERKAAREAMHERMVKKFDKDGDGKLSADELENMKNAKREKSGRGKHDGAAREGNRQRRGPDDRRRPGFGADGPRGPRGPGGAPLPSPEEMFDKFDTDNNDSLSRDEFKKMTAFVHEHRPIGPPPGRPDGGPRFRRPGPDDRGPEFRRPDGPRDGDRPREFRRGDGPPRGDRPDRPRDEDRRRRWRDRDDRPDGPPRDADRDRDDAKEDKAEKAEDESA